MHMRFFLLPLLAPLALAYSKVYQLRGIDQFTPSTECFDVKPYSSWSLLDYRDPSVTLNLTAHKPILKKKTKGTEHPSVAVLFYDRTAIERVGVCDHSAVESELCDESDLGKFTYNVSSGFVEEFLWTELYSNKTIPVPQGGSFCVKALDSDAFSYSIQLRVHTSNGLNEQEIENMVLSSAEAVLYIASSVIVLLLWRRRASCTPFLIKAIVGYFICEALVKAQNAYYHFAFARFEDESGSESLLKYVVSLVEEITSYSARLFFFLYSGGAFYASYEFPPLASVRVPVIVLSLMCMASFFCKEFIEDNMPHFLAHLVLIILLAIYTLVRFYWFRNSIEDKDSLDYKRLVWTTLWFYMKGVLSVVLGFIFHFLRGIYDGATGSKGTNFFLAMFLDIGILITECLISLLVLIKLWIPSSRYQRVDLAKEVD